MAPYFILVIILFLVSSFAEYTKSTSFVYKSFQNFILLVCAFFLGARDETVGTDTGMYVFFYNRGVDDSLSEVFTSKSNYEIAYKLCGYIAKSFTENYFYLLFLVALVTLWFQIRTIYKLSIDPPTSLFVFLTFGTYLFAFNGMRQAMASAVVMALIPAVRDRRFWHFLFLFIIGFNMHKSIIIFLPFYFLIHKPFSFKNVSLILFGTASCMVALGPIMSLAAQVNSNYAVYAEMEASGGQLLTLAFVSLCTLFVASRSLVKGQFGKEYDIFLYMFFIGALVYVIVQVMGLYIELTRIGAYFLLSAVFIWPILFKSYNQGLKILLSIFFLVFHFTFMYIFISKIGNLNPYIMNTSFF